MNKVCHFALKMKHSFSTEREVLNTVSTQQVLIEAFIVNAKSDFAKALGARVGAMSVSERGTKGTTTISGITGGGNAATSAADIALGSVAGTVSNHGIAGTSGIGILKQVGARALKLSLIHI